jgi:hypothetical protein
MEKERSRFVKTLVLPKSMCFLVCSEMVKYYLVMGSLKSSKGLLVVEWEEYVSSFLSTSSATLFVDVYNVRLVLV